MEKDKETVTPTEEKKEVYGSYLLNKTVRVLPVKNGGKWSTLLAASSQRKDDPFLYNKVKRSFDVPLKPKHQGGGIKRILDDQKRVMIKKYETTFPNGMTQQEFFEKELEVNLNPSLPLEDNFWRRDGARRNKVIMKKDGLTLNLNEPLDMLRFLILMSNNTKVAPSYEHATNPELKRATYDWMIVDESKVTSKKVELAEVKAEAYSKFGEITSTDNAMINFIKALGRTLPANYNTNWLKSEVLKVLENDEAYFLSILKDVHYDTKVFIQEAVEVGAIRRLGKKRYTLDNGIELGDVYDVINWINDPENNETKLRIKHKIEVSKR